MQSQIFNLSEQRCEQRVFVRMPVDLVFARGFTRDISSSGCYIYLESTKDVPSGVISFTLHLKNSAVKFQRQCEGRIVRFEPEISGMAIEIFESIIVKE